MRKSDLISQVALHAQLPARKAEHVVCEVFDQITNALARGESVTLIGFGTFITRNRAQRKGVNPQTKQPIIIAQAKVPSFKAGTKFKQAVNNN